MDLKRLDLPRAYQAVSRALEEEILSGRLATGAQLPTEAELAGQFGVTRHTVREGMRVLEQSGLVRREAGRRLHVALPRHKEIGPHTARALVMQRVTFRELWEVAMSLEVLTIDLAMSHDRQRLADRLRDNLRRMEEARARDESIIALDVEFHNLIGEAADNRVLLLSREPVSQLFYNSLSNLLDHPRMAELSSRRLIDAHKRIIETIERGDAAGARAWMARHIADFRRGYEHAGLALDEPIARLMTARGSSHPSD